MVTATQEEALPLAVVEDFGSGDGQDFLLALIELAELEEWAVHIKSWNMEHITWIREECLGCYVLRALCFVILTIQKEVEEVEGEVGR